MEDLQKHILNYLTNNYFPEMNEKIKKYATWGLIASLIIAVGCFFIIKAKKTNEPKPKDTTESE